MTLDYTLIGVLKTLDMLGILHRYDHLIHPIMTPGVIDNLPNYQTHTRAYFLDISQEKTLASGTLLLGKTCVRTKFFSSWDAGVREIPDMGMS